MPTHTPSSASPENLPAALRPRTRWQLPSEPPAALRRAFSPLLASALARRGFETVEEAQAFLARETSQDNPFRLADMNEAVFRLRAALRDGETIAVYGDYDADGITATALLTQTLRALGGEVIPFIPHRERDGYGLSAPALDDLARRGARVVVTVDCGIRAADEVEHARSLDLDVIVTDHHALPENLPGALAVINPRREDCRYGYVDLAGVGMAFKLAQALLRVEAQSNNGIAPLDETSLLDLVAVGTVADVVPLRGENRALVHRGLQVLRDARRPGMRALMAVAKQPPAQIDSRGIGYVIGPRINAAGRMADAEIALHTLLADEPARAKELAAELEALNLDRRAATEVAQAQAEATLAADIESGAPFLFWASPDVAIGVIGLVAGRLSGAHYRPAAALRLEGELARGSLRSIDELNLVDALAECDDLLVRWGGHARAAGLTVKHENVNALAERLKAIAERTFAGSDLRPSLEIDAEVAPEQINWALHEQMESLQPFGQSNRRPLLLARGVPVLRKSAVGQGRHARLTLQTGAGALGAIAFGQGDRIAAIGDRLDVVFGLKIDTWRGERRLELDVRDFAAPGLGSPPLEA
jgi:single-stranded-DNA-specific exonuclease